MHPTRIFFYIIASLLQASNLALPTLNTHPATYQTRACSSSMRRIQKKSETWLHAAPSEYVHVLYLRGGGLPGRKLNKNEAARTQRNSRAPDDESSEVGVCVYVCVCACVPRMCTYACMYTCKMLACMRVMHVPWEHAYIWICEKMQRIHAYIYIHACTYIYAQKYTDVFYIFTYGFFLTHMWNAHMVYTWHVTSVCMYACMYVYNMYSHTSICKRTMNKNVHIYIHNHTHTHTYKSTCMHAYICLCKHTCIHANTHT
jgi:hypothetical protein